MGRSAPRLSRFGGDDDRGVINKLFHNIDLRFGVKVKHRAKTHCGRDLRLAQ
jgi:hypothetical protein